MRERLRGVVFLKPADVISVCKKLPINLCCSGGDQRNGMWSHIFVKHYLFHHFNRFFLDVNLRCEECEVWKYICSILNNLGYFYLGAQFMSPPSLPGSAPMQPLHQDQNQPLNTTLCMSHSHCKKSSNRFKWGQWTSECLACLKQNPRAPLSSSWQTRAAVPCCVRQQNIGSSFFGPCGLKRALDRTRSAAHY